MNELGLHGLGAGDLFALFGHFLMLSLLAVGGAITTAPDMHRYVVGERHWLSDDLFTASVALAQAAPGPNVLFVAVLGFNAAGLAGAAATLLGIMLPSTTLALWATRWSHSRRDTLGVRAFKTGLAPLTLGLLLATGWILADPVRDRPAAIVLIGVTVAVMLKTRLSPLWLVALGAIVGALGWV
ncbi:MULTISPECIES: chromate transporter [unclassified Rhizobacter]|uniref:chromate transporter n=1 Tax=unclassified Rhizobacter TaxID=2640088 RepID=UPI000B2B0F3C|nr:MULTISPECIES: chromate transporter [unclassified Rhizobacter]